MFWKCLFVFCENATTVPYRLRYFWTPLTRQQRSGIYPSIVIDYPISSQHRSFDNLSVGLQAHSSLSAETSSRPRRRSTDQISHEDGGSGDAGYNVTAHSFHKSQFLQLWRLLQQLKRENTTDCGEKGKKIVFFLLLPSLWPNELIRTENIAGKHQSTVF